MSIITLGIDLAKNVFALHGVDAAGKPVLAKPKVARDQLFPIIANILNENSRTGCEKPLRGGWNQDRLRASARRRVARPKRRGVFV